MISNLKTILDMGHPPFYGLNGCLLSLAWIVFRMFRRAGKPGKNTGKMANGQWLMAYGDSVHQPFRILSTLNLPFLSESAILYHIERTGVR
jgi:hypothetical protein